MEHKVGTTRPRRGTEGEFIARLYRDCRRLCLRLLTNEDAEECVSCLVVRLWTSGRSHLDAYRTGQLPRSWLRVCVRNAARDFIADSARRRARIVCFSELAERSDDRNWRLNAPSAPIDVLAAVIKRAELDEARAALAALEEPVRRILILRFFRDQHWEEIGNEFGLTADAVRKRIWRVLSQTSRELATSRRPESRQLDIEPRDGTPIQEGGCRRKSTVPREPLAQRA
ncbi:MAG TPA: sigma-70 family RNA polymerase sigma factor [Chthonomonadaceae bacterium]|nr:sigma-70 family RNA polymerase sigma factor [Chthonomonadaceae bacterium]